jgi:hypothetical protein
MCEGVAAERQWCELQVLDDLDRWLTPATK